MQNKVEGKLARQGSPVRVTLTLPLKASAVSHWVLHALFRIGLSMVG